MNNYSYNSNDSMDYSTSISNKHSFVSYSQFNQTFYISLWNGVLRDGKLDDIDILFFEAKNPKIIDGTLSFADTTVQLTPTQLKFLQF